MSKIISANNATEGMVLSEPILNKLGQVLLGAEVVISNKHINFFKMWNIELISIQSDDEDMNTNVVSAEDVETAKSNLFKRLSWKPRNQNEEDLIELGIIYETKRMNKLID
jgi:hypothetical protein